MWNRDENGILKRIAYGLLTFHQSHFFHSYESVELYLSVWCSIFQGFFTSYFLFNILVVKSWFAISNVEAVLLHISFCVTLTVHLSHELTHIQHYSTQYHQFSMCNLITNRSSISQNPLKVSPKWRKLEMACHKEKHDYPIPLTSDCFSIISSNTSLAYQDNASINT